MADHKTGEVCQPGHRPALCVPSVLDEIADHARALGCGVASVEYPGYVRVRTMNGRAAHVGTANGPWQADWYERGRQDDDGAQPTGSFVIPESHRATAEGIARYVVGKLAGIVGYTAYASERECKAADRAERAARRGRL